MNADEPRLTTEQLEAVRAAGRSVIVSAAAGSGKTTVLAERCAYLVCDAPEGERCDVDRLLVLTFTDAAAAEMRSRIIEAIRRRSAANPSDARLREQRSLAESAHISTIHSFCRWMIRRWFHLAGVDPTVTQLDEHEAELLRRETLEALFARRYAEGRVGGDPLGMQTVERPSDTPVADAGIHPESGEAFLRLVDVYGLGDDRPIGDFVLRLHAFTSSLPDPDDWLDAAVESLANDADRVIQTLADELRRELRMQKEHCEALADAWSAAGEVCAYHAGRIREYADRVGEWLTELNGREDAERERFERLRAAIAKFDFGRSSAPRLPGETPNSTKELRNAASNAYSKLKKKLFEERLLNRFGRFSIDEWREGMRRIEPFVATIVSLVRSFRRQYDTNKRRMNALDFADLERIAFDLLNESGDGNQAGERADVVRSLRDRFVHVLVDEFQDINPLQQAILERVSRETDPDRPANLFVVGDVKQSIYRFRLAEPNLFLQRLHRFQPPGARGKVVYLRSNFRSRPLILEAVNLVFRRLMHDPEGGIAYDELAELRPGRTTDAPTQDPPVELHLVESDMREPGVEPSGKRGNDEHSEDDPTSESDASESDESLDDTLRRGATGIDDATRWKSIEREAYVIGTRIRELVTPAPSGDRPEAPPVRYRDIAVLLRATKVSADQLAAALSAMGIPVHAEVGGSFFQSLEIRDALAALRLLDNFRQDIPLASALRSGIFGDRFTADELAAFRLIDRESAFHEAVRAYAERGEDASLRARIGAMLARIDRLRDEARRGPLSDALWNLYENQGYLGFVGGLPNGTQRRANLLKLHDFARTFGTFRRQGLRRFLHFVDSMADGERDLGQAASIGEGDDVVRIMSIHHAKGLEFPIVFVAGLGTKFNLGDRAGRMIFERKSRIGLRVVETDRMIEYDSAPHRDAAAEIERSARDEEMRILYVAMTRARDRLILVGSTKGVGNWTSTRTPDRPVLPGTRLQVAAAMTPLDWLLAALSGQNTPRASGLFGKVSDHPLFIVTAHDRSAMSDWRLAPSDRDADESLRNAVARLDPLPADEPVSRGDPQVESVRTRLRNPYPWLAAASVHATVAAGRFKGAFSDTPTDEIGSILESERLAPLDSFRSGGPSRDQAARRGVITHRVLQQIDFSRATDADGLASELQRMIAERLLTDDERSLMNADDIAWFLTTPLAEAIRRAGAGYRRELRFITTEPLSFFDETVESPDDDRVLVRGIVDGILPTESGEGVEIVDFKTDAVTPDGVAERCERYRPQMTIYARAVERLLRRPVRNCRLVFLTPRVVASLTDFPTTS